MPIAVSGTAIGDSFMKIEESPARLELDIGGMTCASCAARVEKRLNKLEGVNATVNYATERATVTADRPLEGSELIGEVEAAGYSAEVAPDPYAEAATGPEDALDGNTHVDRDSDRGARTRHR